MADPLPTELARVGAEEEKIGGWLLTNVVQDQVFRSRYSGPWWRPLPEQKERCKKKFEVEVEVEEEEVAGLVRPEGGWHLRLIYHISQESKNTEHVTLAHNFPKRWPILEKNSPADSAVIA